MQAAYIVAGYRTPITKAKKGGFRFMRPDDLATVVIQKIRSDFPQLEVTHIDDLIVGTAVPEAEQGLQMARWIAVQALGIEVPGVSINRYCASGLEAVAMATAKIRSGLAHCILAGGAESMSLVPTMGWKTAPNYRLATDHADYFLNMGLTAEEVALEYGISRAQADEFALQSHQKALRAIEQGKFAQEIVPVEVEEVTVEHDKRVVRRFTVTRDEGPREDTSLKALAALKPVFKTGGQVTAGNSSQTSDGAAFLLLMSETLMRTLQIKPIAMLKSCVCAGVHPRLMGIGPVAAVPKALTQAGLTLNQIDLIELNEAFAAQALAVIKALDMDPEKVNPNGGAIALGHPLGCTGAVLTIKAINELRRRNQKNALITACVGGGQGIAGIVEVV